MARKTLFFFSEAGLSNADVDTCGESWQVGKSMD